MGVMGVPELPAWNWMLPRFWFPPVATLLVVFGIWEASVRIFAVPEYVLPAPSAILLLSFRESASLGKHLGYTALESLLGFLLGSCCAFISSISFAYSSMLKRASYIYIVALKAVPIVAVAPLLILWFGNGLFGKVVMAALICFFPVLVNMISGLQRVPPEALDLFRSLSASRVQILAHLQIPASLPFFFSGLKVASTLAVVGAIVAELAGADRGIGFVIVIASYQLDTTRSFAAILYLALFGIAFFGAVCLIELFFSRFKPLSNQIVKGHAHEET